MLKVSTQSTQPQGFAIIDDGNWRGIVAPKIALSSARLSMLIDDLEDTDPKFLSETNEEYKQAKIDNSFTSSSEIEKELGLE